MKTTRPERLSVDDRYFLFAIINALANRIQMAGDSLCEEVTWKQSFAMLALSVYASPPSISQLAEMIGTSHQNMKQLLLRLQKAEFVILEKTPQINDRHWCGSPKNFLILKASTAKLACSS